MCGAVYEELDHEKTVSRLEYDLDYPELPDTGELSPEWHGFIYKPSVARLGAETVDLVGKRRDISHRARKYEVDAELTKEQLDALEASESFTPVEVEQSKLIVNTKQAEVPR
jgi:hypothetical protein